MRTRCVVQETVGLGNNLWIAVLLGLQVEVSAMASAPILTAADRTGGQFQFTLNGETNRAYIIEATTNLQAWSPIRTNYDSAASRSVLLGAPNPQSFYRAREAAPVFGFALAAKNSIDLNGNDLRTDSFDSSDPLFSTAGRYDPVKSKDGGDIAAYLGVTNALSIGNLTVYGRLLTGSNVPVSIGVIGAVGSKAWIDAGNHGIEAGWLRDDMKVDFPEVKPPFTAAFTPAKGSYTVGGVTYDYVIGSGNWAFLASRLTGKVIVIGAANVYIGPRASISLKGGTDGITIQSNATLNLYVDSTNADFSGQGVQNAGLASQFVYWGTTNNTSLLYGGNSSFNGVIYAPDADFSLGSTNSAFGFSGSCVTKSVKLNGYCAVHFDESLKRTGPFD